MNSLFTGGAEYSSLAFYGWMRAQGHEVKVIILKQADPRYDPEQFGLVVTRLTATGKWQQWREAMRQLHDFRPQVVHSVLFDANLLGRWCRMAMRSFVHIESLVNEMYSPHRYHDPQVTPLKLTAYRVLDWVTQLAGVDHYHANGVSVAQHYQQKLGISPSRITVIPRGRSVNPWVGNQEEQGKVRKELGTATRQLWVNLARHEYQKGQDSLLEALARLGQSAAHIHLVVVGREGKLTPVLREKIKQLKIEEHVTLLGHRTDVARLLAAADVFVFPSRFEGLPGALIEAEAAGLPIIASDIPNTREVVSEYENALLFPVDDVENLSGQMSRLLNDEVMRKSFGAKSLQLFENQFSIEPIHHRMKTMLEHQCNTR